MCVLRRMEKRDERGAAARLHCARRPSLKRKCVRSANNIILCMYTYVFMYVCYICMYAYVCMHMNACMYVCMYVCISIGA